MMAVIIPATLLAIVLLVIVTSVQQLYLESMRLRPRDLPSVKFFKETLEDRLGMKIEAGMETFSVTKHSLLVIVGVLCMAWSADGIPWSWTSLGEGALSAWLVMMGASYAVPQLLYRRTTARWMLRFVPLFRAMAVIVKPIVALLDFFQSLVQLTDDTGKPEEEPTPAENIEALISAGTEEGLIEEDDRKLMQGVLEFGDKIAREVMTPRPNIVAIAADATLDELRQLVINEQYSRIPVYEHNIDQMIGFIHVRDMFELEEEERANRKVRELLRPVKFVPETKPVNDLMRQMQQENTHMVIVVDEYGNTAGLATMEDLLEVIIGEIRDEHEPDSDVVEDGHGGYIVSGSFELDRIAGLFDTFHREEDIESSTVGGLVSEWMGHVPKPGEWADRDGVRIEVLASDEFRVERVRISKSQTVAHE
jgi:CBS domain containing-hemolysin-like protein